MLEDLREVAQLAAEIGLAGLDIGVFGDQQQRALLQTRQRPQQVERDQQGQQATAGGDAEGEPAGALLAFEDPAEQDVGTTQRSTSQSASGTPARPTS